METKTKYKVLDFGEVKFLQYLKQDRLLFVFNRSKWVNIPYPNGANEYQFICSKLNQYGNLKKFIIKYPDIDEYFDTEYLQRKAKFKGVRL